MASTEHIHVRCERRHCHIFPSKVSAHQHRETNSLACRVDILALKYCLPG